MNVYEAVVTMRDGLFTTMFTRANTMRRAAKRLRANGCKVHEIWRMA